MRPYLIITILGGTVIAGMIYFSIQHEAETFRKYQECKKLTSNTEWCVSVLYHINFNKE